MSSRRKSKEASAPPPANAMVFADASLCGQTGAAGWGDVVMLQSDSLNTLRRLRTHLEAIDNPAKDGPRATPMKASPGRLTARQTAAIEAIRKVKTALSLTLVVRHVKGHAPGGGRSWVNRTCDDVAKLHMRAGRAALDQLGAGATT